MTLLAAALLFTTITQSSAYGLSPQTNGMPVIHKKPLPGFFRAAVFFCNAVLILLSAMRGCARSAFRGQPHCSRLPER